MRNERKIAVISIAALLLAVLGLSLLTAVPHRTEHPNSYNAPLPAAPKTENVMQGISQEDWSVDDTFSTHLPLIVIDTGNERPPISTQQGEDGVFQLIPGVEPYRYGSIHVIDTGGLNNLKSEPDHVSPIAIKRRGNSSMLYQKAQYLIKLQTESGQDNFLDLLDLGAECEWVLNGSMADKSMMRNYLSYRLASQFMPFTPDSRYCEVVYHENGRYYYEGVYLLIESIKQGEERVAISESKSSDPYPSYIVRRDRFAEDDTILDTWATQKGLRFTPDELNEHYLGLIYPTMKNATKETIDFVTGDISRIEKVLYSDDEHVFSTYPRYIDVDSFIDYFIFNEFFGSYDAGINSTYMYKEVGGKLYMGPVWDLDNAMDNYKSEPLNVNVTAFQIKPWFDRLIRDSDFLAKLEKRYTQLRRGPLSDENYLGTIDAIVAHLGPATDREWTRWAHVYTTFNRYSMQNYGENHELVRNTDEFRQEVYRLKTSITQHAAAIGPYLRILRKSTIVNTGLSIYSPLLLLVTVLVFLIPAFYASRK
ncbi:CotH protein [Desulfitobacterium dehalogenans ATCC 51507]|uniref:CotH protein n=1 Tax=Desulfitobacterium dehalogenans (strain ATCC 51507 / DSM 9161 / JW/IU-DC1) TaxID=756499 RepID=I4A4A9_DESDJ|nr:CotH kinase family protein [Desulfitobacterium dehalogenans]AFL98793.1 CotH protein [Desulfitobacterium dehalogenans ATCC 51507]